MWSIWSLVDYLPYAYTISMSTYQKVFAEVCELIESSLPVHCGIRKEDYPGGEMFCRYSIPAGLIIVREDKQNSVLQIFSTMDLLPILKETYPSLLPSRNGTDKPSDYQEGSGGIDIEMDEFPCKKCRSFHPTLTWHEKFNDYLLGEAIWIDKYREALQKYGLEHFAQKAQSQFVERLTRKGLEMSECMKHCVICTFPTYFFNVSTGRYVCSDECRNMDGCEKEQSIDE